MALTCNEQALNSGIAALRGLTHKQKLAALVFYLYREKNTSSTGQVTPGDVTLSAGTCLRDCATDSDYLSMLVWIQRQEAIDAGHVAGTFSASTLVSNTCQLNCLSDKKLKALEVLLRCQVS